jgi:hypothetical protein
VIRETLIKCETYDCAYRQLTKRIIAAPVYFAVAGNETYQGAIISRDSSSAVHIQYVNSTSWFAVQANDDHFSGLCT